MVAGEDQGARDDVERAAIEAARQCDRHQQHDQRREHGFVLAQAQRGRKRRRVDRDNGEQCDQQRAQQRPAYRHPLHFRAVGHQADGGDAETERSQDHGEHARRGAGPEGKAAHAGKIPRCPQRKRSNRDQHQAAVEVLWIANSQATRWARWGLDALRHQNSSQ